MSIEDGQDQFLAFRTALSNSDFHADREKTRRVDCVIFKDTRPCVFYEIKSYFKPHERVRKKHFDNDLQKLMELLKSHSDARAFFFVAGAQANLSTKALASYAFARDKLFMGDHAWVKYTLPNDSKVRLRPSRRQFHGRSVVRTWEVKIA